MRRIRWTDPLRNQETAVIDNMNHIILDFSRLSIDDWYRNTLYAMIA